MPFFKKSKSTLPSAYSAEQLASSDDSPQHRRLSAYDDPYTHPAHVARSQSHRHIASPPASPDWSDREPRIRNVFSRSAAKNSSRGFLERSLSVRRSDQSPTSPGPASGSGHALDSDQMQDCSPGLINRSNTDSSLDRSNRHPYRPSDQLYPPSARPETQQPVGPPSPFHSEMTAERERRDKEVKEKEEPKEEAVDVRALVQKHDELQSKYSKVKRYYFEKDAQVQHLQNTVAHQRMAVSRTVLDDNEYASRFNRLDGAIKDLAFSVRKVWKTLPPWLHGFVNDDAHMVGMKEMTAIGRAVISRWLVEEIFHRHFHPSLEPNLSMQLKSIEMNLRHQQVKSQTEEDKENAIAKISNWRRATFDGLGDTIQGKTADENRAKLIDHLVTKLVASLEMGLADPPPPGLDSSARMIIENTVGIAEKIPLESRDVCIEYFSPGSTLNETLMKVETSVPPLTNVKQEEDRAEEQPDDSSSGTSEGSRSPVKEKKKPSVFSSLMGKKEGRSPGKGKESDDSPPSQTIRFASFLAAEVRGKGPTNVLIKAPVYVNE